jgi:hypothetical protein
MMWVAGLVGVVLGALCVIYVARAEVRQAQAESKYWRDAYNSIVPREVDPEDILPSIY